MRRSVSVYRQVILTLAVMFSCIGCQSSRWYGPSFDKPLPFVESCSFSPANAAESAYARGIELESLCDSRCVDAYYEAATLSWHLSPRFGECCGDPKDRASSLYQSSLGKLVDTANRFGRLHQTQGLEILGPHGKQIVPVHYHHFLWQPEDFNEFLVAGDYSSNALNHAYRTPGLGVPLVVKRKRNFDEPMRQREQVFAATVILRPDSADSTESFSLDFCDPLRCESIVIQSSTGTERVPIYRDLTAPHAYVASTNNSFWLESFLTPRSNGNVTGLYSIEPHQPGKIPLIFVHGLLSDSTTWLAMANELQARPDIRDRYQIWAFQYPTGEPFITSARALREELAEAIRQLDPYGQDPAMSEMVLVGHSMGGLIAKLQIASSGDQLWNTLANRPLDQIVATEEMRADLARSWYFEPQSAIKRVVFIATPHRGAGSAQRLVGRIASSLVNEPEERQKRHRWLVDHNPGVFSKEVLRRIPTSIDMLEPSSCLLKTIEHLPTAPAVTLHSVIGDYAKLVCKPTDCVVPVSSARIVGVASEKFISAKHTTIQKTPAAICEVIRILELHAQTADLLMGDDERVESLELVQGE